MCANLTYESWRDKRRDRKAYALALERLKTEIPDLEPIYEEKARKRAKRIRRESLAIPITEEEERANILKAEKIHKALMHSKGLDKNGYKINSFVN